MKENKRFEKPEMEFVRFEATDVITTSMTVGDPESTPVYSSVRTFGARGKGFGDEDFKKLQ